MKTTLIILLLAVLFGTTSCIGKPGCNDSCDLEEGCSSGLSCLATGQGYKCVPDECSGCTTAKPTCSFTMRTDSNNIDSCSFNQCQ